MKKLLIVAALGALSLPAFAQVHSTPRIDQRQENQERRIEQGIRLGQINRREAFELRSELREIRRMERRAAADGRISPREQARIDQAQDQLSRNIARARADFHTQDRLSGNFDRERHGYQAGR
jgi:hypothetical protein